MRYCCRLHDKWFLFVLLRRNPSLEVYFCFWGASLWLFCFVHLLPEAFRGRAGGLLSSHIHSHSHHDEHSSFAPMGVCALGFVLQRFWSFFPRVQNTEPAFEENSKHKSGYCSALMVVAGVSIHAFLGDLPWYWRKMNYSLLLGVFFTIFHSNGCCRQLSAAGVPVLLYVLPCCFCLMGSSVGSLWGCIWTLLQTIPVQISALLSVFASCVFSTLFDSRRVTNISLQGFVMLWLPLFWLVCCLH